MDFREGTKAHATLAVFWLDAHLVVAGDGLLWAPALALDPAGVPLPKEPWARVAGAPALCRTVHHVVATRSGAAAVTRVMVPVRATAARVFTALVDLSLAPAGLLLSAAVDFAGALWTAPLTARSLSRRKWGQARHT